jgi:lipopolysaccharide export system protein LptC
MKNNKTLILLVLAGLGVWWYMRNKNKPEDKKSNTVKPDISNVPVSKQASDLNISFSINGYKKRLGNVPNTI